MSAEKNSAINGLTGITLEKVRELLNNTEVVGEPVTVRDDITIIPVSKVSVGFVSGGSDVGQKVQKEMFGGGTGAGVTLTPIAFIVVSANGVKLLQLNPASATIDNLVQTVPEVVDKISDIVARNRPADKSADADVRPE